MKPPHRCQYCKAPCQLEYVVDYTVQGNQDFEEVWKCDHHPVRVRYVIFSPYPSPSGEDIWIVCFSVFIGGERYSIQVHYPDAICIISHVTINPASFDQEELIRFPFHGEITPTNAQNKLPTILTFL
jgi:hypothetical protein